MKTSLADTALASGAILAPYAGAETAADFGDVTGEFRAITRSAGVYDLGWRAKLKVTGEDRQRWLNGMVTNNVKDLRRNHGNYNFVLNAQGRIQGDLYVYERGDHYLLDTELSQRETLLEHLNHFIIMDDVEVADVSPQLTSVGVQGPDSAELLKKLGVVPDCADPLVVCDSQFEGQLIHITRMVSEKFLTYELWMRPDVVTQFWQSLVTAGAKPVGTAALELFRVFAGVPKFGQDIRPKDLPQETRQTHALNFNKGCYLGQEIVERIRSRGAVHREFTGFVLDAQVPPGAEALDQQDRRVAELTSVAPVPTSSGKRVLGLGYMRREAGGEGTELRFGSTRAVVCQLPFELKL